MFSKSNQKSGSESTQVSTSSGVSGSSLSSSSKANTGSGVPSIISSDLRVEGDMHSNGDVQIDGQVTGDITSKTLTLGEGSHVSGSVNADTVRVCGTLEGELKASSVFLTKTARVIGDVMHDSLVIEAGAYIDGHCRRTDSDHKSSVGPSPKTNGAAVETEKAAAPAVATAVSTAS